MDDFYELPVERQRTICEATGDVLGISPAAIEKDAWVCRTLGELFADSEIGPHLTFKGGTSLSKCWGHIKRFSEDLDLTLNRDVLELGSDEIPAAEVSNAKNEKRLDHLQERCRHHVRSVILPKLKSDLEARSLGGMAHVSVRLDDEDEQTILVEYQSAFERDGYLRPVVKVELGVRSDIEPHVDASVEAYVFRGPHSGLGNGAFSVRALAPERTFWEKVSLLHEHCLGEKEPGMRLSRHFYDLWCLDRAGVADIALGDPTLFRRVVEHRRVWFRKNREVQQALSPGTVRLRPLETHIHGWRADYERMKDTMFFEEPPTFMELMEFADRLERRINAIETR